MSKNQEFGKSSMRPFWQFLTTVEHLIHPSRSSRESKALVFHMIYSTPFCGWKICVASLRISSLYQNLRDTLEKKVPHQNGYTAATEAEKASAAFQFWHLHINNLKNNSVRFLSLKKWGIQGVKTPPNPLKMWFSKSSKKSSKSSKNPMSSKITYGSRN